MFVYVQLVNAAITDGHRCCNSACSLSQLLLSELSKEAVRSESMQADSEQAAHTNLNFQGVRCHGTMRCNIASSVLCNSHCSVWNFGLAARGQIGA